MDYYQKYLKYKDKYIKLKELRGGYILPPLNETNKSEIAIVCHCSPQYQLQNQHPRLYFIDINNQIIEEMDKNIKYYDPTCPEDSWDKIVDNSLMYIWGIGCPIYRSFENHSKIVDILKNLNLKLKVDGKVFFKIVDDLSFFDANNKLFEFFNNMCEKMDLPYTFKIVERFHFPYIISEKNNYDRNFKIKGYYVFTKIS
jgi:hypothetical protein